MAAFDTQPSFRAITAVAQTATQTSEVISNPKHRSLIARLNVTAGATLSLTLALVAILADGTEVAVATHGTALTGVSTQITVITPSLLSPPAPTTAIQCPLPVQFKLRVVHGNANAATYTLDAIWT